METALSILGIIVACFAFFKALLVFYKFLYPELDEIHRANLESLIDSLDAKSFFEIFKNFIVRLDHQISAFMSHKTLALTLLFTAFFIINVLFTFIGYSHTIFTHILFSSAGYEVALEGLLDTGPLNCTLIILFVGTLGSLFDFLSFTITRKLIAHAARAGNTRVFIFHLGLDVFVATLAIVWAFLPAIIVNGLFFGEISQAMKPWAGSNVDQYIGETFIETLTVNPEILYALLTFGLSSALPSIAYFALALLVLAIRFVPRRVQTFVNHRIIFNLCVGEKPVVDQISNLLAAFAAIIVSLVSIFKPS